MPFDAGAVVAKLDLAIDGWKKSVETVKKDQESLAGFAEKHKKGIQDLGKAFTVAGGLMTAALGAIVVKSANAGDEISKLSQRTGVSTELLSGYSLAAKLADVSLEGLGSALKLLSRNMNEASTGTGTAKDAFIELGIAVVNSDGTLRDSNEVMLDVADKFAGMENGAKKTALSMDIFGRSGADLIPMLNLGRKGLEENYTQAQRLGLVYSKEAAQGCEAFNDSITTLKAGLQGAGRQIGEILMPIIQGMVEKVTDVVIKVREWADAHPVLVTAITTLAGGIGAVMLAVGPLLVALPKLVEGFTLAKAAISNLNPVTVATSTAIGLLVIKILEYKDILDQLKGQVAKNTEIDKNWSDAQERSALVLADASIAAGWHTGRMRDLIDAYQGNTAALQADIREGKHGVDIQAALEGAGKRVNDMLGRQKDGFAGLASTLSSNVSPALEEIKKKEEVLAITVDVANDFLSDQETQFLETAAAGSQSYSDMVSDVNSSLDSIVQKSKESNDKIKDDAVDSTTVVSSRWDDLVRDITSSWAEGIRGLVEGTTSFKDFLATTWGNVKQTFFRMIADMVTQWITKGITNMVSAAAEGAAAVSGSMAGIGTTVAGMAASIAGVISALIGAVATGIVTLATAIAGAVVALATGIATAATILAAAAPALLTVGAIAVAIYAGFAAIEALLGTGGGGAGDGMGRVVERQDRVWAVESWWMPQTAALLTALEVHLVDIFEHIGDFFPKIDNLASCINTQGGKICAAIGNIPGAATGALVMGPSLVNVGENAPGVPEVILPLPELGAFARGMAATGAGAIGGAGAGGSQQVFVFKPIVIDKGDKWMIQFVEDTVQAKLNHRDIMVPVSAIGG